MRDIKDYLHLYLGCEVFVFPDATITDGWLERKLIDVPGLQWKYTMTISNYNIVLDAGYKPILRPLSDMTEDEMTDIWKLIGGTPHLFYQEEFMDWIVNGTTPDGILFGGPEIGITSQYLLSKGFDLFGLIEAGLAIDKTTLKVPA